MKGDYGVRALVDLALNATEAPAQSADIAHRQHIPEPYLDQLLTSLRKAGFIRSRRGPQGGHQLARPAAEISFAAVITALEGSVASAGCLDGSLDCALSGVCGQQEIWNEITLATQRMMEAATIGALADRQVALQQRREMYYI